MDKHGAWFSPGNYQIALLPTPQYTTNPDWIEMYYNHLNSQQQLKPVPTPASGRSRRPASASAALRLSEQEKEMHKRRSMPRRNGENLAPQSRPASARSSRPSTAASWKSDGPAGMAGSSSKPRAVQAWHDQRSGRSNSAQAPTALPPVPKSTFASDHDENRPPAELCQFARSVDYGKFVSNPAVSLALRRLRERVQELEQERNPLQPMVMSAR